MKQGGHNGHNGHSGQFLHLLVDIIDTIDAEQLCGHADNLLLISRFSFPSTLQWRVFSLVRHKTPYIYGVLLLIYLHMGDFYQLFFDFSIGCNQRGTVWIQWKQ